MSVFIQKWYRSSQFYSRAILVLLACLLSLTISAHDHAQAEPEDTSPIFTIAQVPDTQQEVMSDTNQMLPGRYQWLSDNKQALNLKFIAQTGDNVNWGVVDPIQFVRDSRAVDILDASTVPYSLAIGNHDGAAVTVGGGAAPGNVHDNLRNTSLFNQTFPLTRFKNVGGTFETNKVDNMWQTFTAGGKNWMLITHEMWPRQSVIDWMKGVVASHPNYNVIVSTHAFIDSSSGNLPTSGNYGDKDALYEWNNFVSLYPNIKMVLSGHYGPASGNVGYAYHEFTGVSGNKVAAIMTAYHSNYQNHVRLLNIDAANNTISSSVYVSVSNNTAYPAGYIHDDSSDFVTTGMNWINPDGSSGGNPTPPANTAPSAPTAVTATAGIGSATVSFTPPTSNGGSPVTGYTVTSSPGAITASGTGSPVTINGLTNGVSYTFTVKATNVYGTSTVSVTSNSVTPFASSPELLPDPGFESGTGSWSPFLVGTFSTVTSTVRNGTKALSIAATAATNNWVGMTNNSVISTSVAGKQYVAQCYVRPVSSSTNLEIRMLEYTQNYSSNIVLGTTKYPNLPAGSWSLVKFTGTAVNNNERVIPQIYATNQTTNTGNVLYDDCSVTAAVPAPVVTVPDAPTAVSAVADDGEATVSFTSPSNNGGSQITNYTITSNPGNITTSGGVSPITVGGLTNDVSYTFTVKATSSAGTSVASAPSSAVTPRAPLVAASAPTALFATPGDGSVSLTWTAPASNGGSAVTDYSVQYRAVGNSIWLPYNDGVSTTTSATLSGLINGTAYEFIVSAINSVGISPASTVAAATPVAPAAPDPVAPSAPQNVTAVAGNGSAVVSFSIPASDGGAAITSYTVTSLADGTTVSGTGSPITVNGLANGVSTAFTVTATNSAGSSVASAASNMVTPLLPATAPGAPTGLTASAADGTVILNWTAPTSDGGAAVNNYNVYYRTQGSSIWLAYAHSPSTDTTIIVAGLANGTIYEFAVAAVNSVGTGNISDTTSARPAAAPPTVAAAPDDVYAVAGHGMATITFDQPHSDGGSPITGYIVSSVPDAITATGNTTTIVVTGLANGTSYTFSVVAVNAVGNSVASAPSNPVTPTPAPSFPTVPTAVSAVAGDASAVVSFSAPDSDGGAPITGYTVTSNPGNITATGSGSPLTVSGLTNGTSYTFYVRANNSVGASDPSNSSNNVTPVSPATVPGAPVSVVGTAGNGQVSLSWTAPISDGGKPVIDFAVQYKTASSNIWLPYADGVSTATATTITGLTNGTAHNFRVAAINEIGTSSYSVSSANVTPVAPITAPGAPTNVSATAGNAQATISFNAPASNGGSAITGYTVTSSPGNITASGSTSPITMTGLTNGTSYTFTVTATNVAGTGAASASSTSVTPVAVVPIVEYLSDPGFESGTGGWTSFIVGTLARVTSPVRSGTGSMNIAATSTTANWVGMTNNNAVANSVAGKTYTAQCYVRPTNTGRTVQMRFLQYTQNYGSNTNIGTVSVTNLSTTAWTLVKVSGVATSSAQRIIPQIYSTNQTSTTGTINYDDCSVTIN
jgi:hypothetical protein